MAPSIADDLVSFDLARQLSGSLEARMPYEVSTAIREGDRLELVSADGYDFGLSVSKTTYSPLGSRIIHASTDGGGKAIIVVDDAGGLLGSITEFGQRYRISTTADGQRLLLREGYSGREKRIDDGGVPPPRADMPDSRFFFDLKEEELSSSPSRVMKAERSSDVIYPTYKTGTAKISVLMYYDDSMSNVFSTIDFITQVANDAYADSGAKIEIDIVGTKALDIDDEASHYDLRTSMSEGEAPFADIESDRSFFEADLVFILRDTEAPDGEDPCGVTTYGVYKQRHYRSRFSGLVQWDPADGVSSYCSDFAFAHEVGHLLGAAHDRADRTEDSELTGGAYSFSYGTSLDGVFRTVMGVSGFPKRLGLFSSPNLNCDGYPCGKPASSADSADNVSTFQSTGHLIASNEGPFAFEAVSTYATRGKERACTTSDETDGFFRGVYIRNQSAFSVELQSIHYGRPDGTYRVFEYEDDAYTLGPSGARGGGYCREEGEDPVMGTTYDKAFFRYLHPETGQIVQTATHEWDDSYEGEYTTVRVASGQGGSVSGNTTQSVRVGSSQTFTFTPVGGYEVANIQSNCSGSKSGNSYTVDVGQDNCFVEASFNRNAFATSFIERFYTNILGRPSDPAGLNAWLNVITTQSAAAVAQGFLSSAEFLNKNLDDSAFIDILYRTLFDREGDAGGVSVWMDQLGAGRLREMVIWDFLRSAEFRNLADSFGVTALNSVDASAYGIRAFVERFYSLVLGRQPDKGGFDNWVTSLANGSYAGGDIAKAFFLSAEYLSQNTSNDAFVSTCYRAFFGREADAGGKQGWLDALAQGQSRAYVLDGFIGSAEFATLASSYGIEASRAASESARVAPESVRMARDPEVELRDSEQAKPIPSLPIFVLFMLGGLMGLFGLRRLRAG